VVLTRLGRAKSLLKSKELWNPRRKLVLLHLEGLARFLGVALCRFDPSFAAQTAVAFEPAPHQMRSRKLWFEAQQPWADLGIWVAD